METRLSPLIDDSGFSTFIRLMVLRPKFILDGNPSHEFPVLDGNPSSNMNSAIELRTFNNTDLAHVNVQLLVITHILELDWLE